MRLRGAAALWLSLILLAHPASAQKRAPEPPARI